MEKIESLMDKVLRLQIEAMKNKLDSIIIEGLNLKGYFFKDKFDLESFISKNCRIENYLHDNSRIFYVFETPFLIYYYHNTFEFSHDEPYKVQCNMGNYRFV